MRINPQIVVDFQTRRIVCPANITETLIGVIGDWAHFFQDITNRLLFRCRMELELFNSIPEPIEDIGDCVNKQLDDVEYFAIFLKPFIVFLDFRFEIRFGNPISQIGNSQLLIV
jgi:hypothetical protein